MAARNGKQYLEGLDDARTVWLGGRKVDVQSEPAFAGSLGGMAGYFDWQLEHADDCLVADPDTGAPMSASLIVPKNADDLARRTRCLDRLARYSEGMLGRTPDYVNVTLAGFVARADIFARSGDTRGAERLCRFHREVIEKDLSLTHTIINPVIDKAIGDVEGLNGELAFASCAGRARASCCAGRRSWPRSARSPTSFSCTRACRCRATASPDYALSYSIPLATPGLHTLCRDHYGTAGPVADRPFSARFDEQDAFMIFDDVLVPWERVFMDGDVESYNALMREGWAANIMQQTCIRAAVKLEFAYELCTRMARATNSEGRPEVAQMLGEILTFATLTRASIRAALADARDWGNGAFFCDDKPLRAIRCMMPSWMVRVNDIIKTIGSHNLLATASCEAFDSPELAPLVERYMPGAKGMSARERAQLFRTAWDFAGSALGGRVELYERFYLASAPRNLALDHVIAQKSGEWAELPAFLAAAGIA